MDLQALFSTLPTLQTSRMTLREIKIPDASDIFKVYGDAEVGRLNGWETLKNVKEARKKIRLFKQQYNLKQRVRWGLYLKSEGRIIGDCAYVNFDFRSDRAEIGFNLAREFWRKGLMTEAAESVIQHGFNVFGFNRIDAIVMPENIPSRKLLQKMNFKEEGLLEEGGKMRGEYCDVMIYGLLKRHWQEINKELHLKRYF